MANAVLHTGAAANVQIVGCSGRNITAFGANTTVTASLFLMAYDHKKSLRTLTDEQFSDGTTVDGSRIDDALEEAVEHFNSIPEGDVSTRFTKTQYVFGYQPAGFTGTPVAGPATTFQATSGTIEGPSIPLELHNKQREHHRRNRPRASYILWRHVHPNGWLPEQVEDKGNKLSHSRRYRTGP